MTKEKALNVFIQTALPVLTLSGQLAVSMKLPQWGLLLNLMAQPFWLYSTWTSYKQAGQIGIFINTVFFGMITLAGVINYWFL